MAILFMAFGSYGSFNPFEIGFYTSIGAAILWFYLSYYGFGILKLRGCHASNFLELTAEMSDTAISQLESHLVQGNFIIDQQFFYTLYLSDG